MMAVLFKISLLFLSISGIVQSEICMEDTCEFTLDIRRIQTMTYAKPDGSGSYNVELDSSNNKLKIVPNSLRLSGTDPLLDTYIEADKVVTAGGYKRNVITVNGQHPGPAIEVMEGADVIIKVVNHLRTDGISIHWHGLYMQKTPWMDGIAYVTQCPIQPRQSFTYRFKAYPAGTHWYHSHMENLRLDGLFGMFVIHKKVPAIPQHHAMVADWWHMSAETMEILNPWATHFRGTGEMHLDPAVRDYSTDGVQLGAMEHSLYTTLINGRGIGNKGEKFPLTVYDVTPTGSFRMRMVHAGVEYPYYVSVDNHDISVVASDGYELNPYKVTHIIIQPGETIDFTLEADQAVGNYWFRVRTIRDGIDFDVKKDNIIRENFAIVRYIGASETDPTTNAHQCTAASNCIIFNCPFAGFATQENKQCVSFNDVTSAIPKAQLDHEYGMSDPDFEEYFFTFAFGVGSGVNSKKFINPTVPLYQPHQDAIVKCEEQDCTKGCRCTQIQTLPFNKTVQMIFSNLQPGADIFSHHPIHVHGHAFTVLKVGFPEYDSNTGLWTDPNGDVVCSDAYCNPARWNGGAPTDVNQENAPVKDTITVPARGYVLVRFRTNNPGFWLVHCHATQHLMDGMEMVFNEAPELHPQVPTNFPKCTNFDMGEDEYDTYEETMYGKKPQIKDKDPEPKPPKTEDKDNEGMEMDPRMLKHNEFAVRLDTAIGSAVGLVLLGAVIAIIPMFCFMYCQRKQEATMATKSSGFSNQGYSN